MVLWYLMCVSAFAIGGRAEACQDDAAAVPAGEAADDLCLRTHSDGRHLHESPTQDGHTADRLQHTEPRVLLISVIVKGTCGPNVL